MVGAVERVRGYERCCGDDDGGEFGAVAPDGANDRGRGCLGKVASGVDEHHRLVAVAGESAGVPAELASRGAAASWPLLVALLGAELALCGEFVAEVVERVFLAVGVGAERGLGCGEQIVEVVEGGGEPSA